MMSPSLFPQRADPPGPRMIRMLGANELPLRQDFAYAKYLYAPPGADVVKDGGGRLYVEPEQNNVAVLASPAGGPAGGPG